MSASREHASAGRAVLERRTIHIEDILALPETEFPETVARARHARLAPDVLAMPLLREGDAARASS